MSLHTFTHQPAETDDVDPGWVLDQNPRFGIQDATLYGGGYVVTESAADDVEPEDFWISHYGVHSDLEAAKVECIQRASN